MAKEKLEPDSDTVKVIDRRRFTEEGERRSTHEAAEPSSPPPPQPAPASGAGRAAEEPAESSESRAARRAYDRSAGREAKMNFEAVVSSLYTAAIYHLSSETPDFDAARQTIDMLAVLQEKTRGNLTPRENQLLNQVLYELRLSFVAVHTGGHERTPGTGS
jgi:hypothetical protein